MVYEIAHYAADNNRTQQLHRSKSVKQKPWIRRRPPTSLVPLQSHPESKGRTARIRCLGLRLDMPMLGQLEVSIAISRQLSRRVLEVVVIASIVVSSDVGNAKDTSYVYLYMEGSGLTGSLRPE
jgi:hypothetical protein